MRHIIEVKMKRAVLFALCCALFLQLAESNSCEHFESIKAYNSEIKDYLARSKSLIKEIKEKNDFYSSQGNIGGLLRNLIRDRRQLFVFYKVHTREFMFYKLADCILSQPKSEEQQKSVEVLRNIYQKYFKKEKRSGADLTNYVRDKGNEKRFAIEYSTVKPQSRSKIAFSKSRNKISEQQEEYRQMLNKLEKDLATIEEAYNAYSAIGENTSYALIIGGGIMVAAGQPAGYALVNKGIKDYVKGQAQDVAFKLAIDKVKKEIDELQTDYRFCNDANLRKDQEKKCRASYSAEGSCTGCRDKCRSNLRDAICMPCRRFCNMSCSEQKCKCNVALDFPNLNDYTQLGNFGSAFKQKGASCDRDIWSQYKAFLLPTHRTCLDRCSFTCDFDRQEQCRTFCASKLEKYRNPKFRPVTAICGCKGRACRPRPQTCKQAVLNSNLPFTSRSEDRRCYAIGKVIGKCLKEFGRRNCYQNCGGRCRESIALLSNANPAKKCETLCDSTVDQYYNLEKKKLKKYCSVRGNRGFKDVYGKCYSVA